VVRHDLLVQLQHRHGVGDEIDEQALEDLVVPGNEIVEDEENLTGALSELHHVELPAAQLLGFLAEEDGRSLCRCRRPGRRLGLARVIHHLSHPDIAHLGEVARLLEPNTKNEREELVC
jgi:hypothetical protein